MTKKLNLPRFSKTSFAIVLLLVTALALPAAAQKLTPSEIDTLKARLVEAGDVYNALDARVQCYEDKDASLQVHSRQLQTTAGDLRRQDLESSKQLAQTKKAAEEFRRDLEAARQEMHNLQGKTNNIEARIRVRQAAVDDCKSKWWTINFTCDWAGEIVGLNGELRKLSAERQATDIKVSSLQKDLPKAESQHKDAEKQFRVTKIESAQTKQNIAAAEAKIKEIKKSLSKIRTVKQDYFAKLGDLQDAITEFEGLDPSSDRRFIVRRLRRESADLDDLLVKARVLLENGLLLPSGDRICAN
jgi:chromosome segregation ATPase